MEIRRDILARIVQEINLEVAKPNLFQAIVAKQNDYNSRFLKVTFVNNGEKINIDSTLTATINAERPDGASKRFDAVVNDDGTVTAPLTGWMLELQGLVSCDISVLTDEGKLTTTDFSINVNEAACSDEDISNDDNYDILQELIIKVETLEENLDLSDYVKNTQFADNQGNPGILRVKASYGVSSGRYDGKSPSTGDTITISRATNDEIKGKTNLYKPIVPGNLDYAAKMALTDSKIEWTEKEKQAAKNLLGITTANNKIVLDNVCVPYADTNDVLIGFNKTITPGKTYQLLYYNLQIGMTYKVTSVAFDDYYNKLEFSLGHPSDGTEYVFLRFTTINGDLYIYQYSVDADFFNNSLCMITLTEL
jgi:hypothetical protein